MKRPITQEERPELIGIVVSEAKQAIGRTAAMKLVYFLQTLREMPLGYRFSLYTYGPFSQEVLADLAHAESKKLIKSTLVAYANGNYGYQIEAKNQKFGSKFGEYRDHIRWVIDKFGDRSASDLEMASTIIFVDRSFKQTNRTTDAAELAQKVHTIKPHLEKNRIAKEVDYLKKENLLAATI
jgi:uncharacterized protein YwgA